MAKKVTLRRGLIVEWEKIYLGAQQALSYLHNYDERPSKAVHRIISKNVKKRAGNILNLTKDKKK